MDILHVDIETAPNLAHVWGLWEQNVSLNQLITEGYVLCWAAKWDGEKKVHFSSLRKSTQHEMLSEVHELLGQADAIVTYNGASFDVPILNSEFVKLGFPPPPPTRNIDLLTIIKSRFRFPSNKLEYVAKELGVGEKEKHEGHELWIGCMSGDAASWKKMESYNKHDVELQEGVYNVVKGWIPNHPNVGLYSDDARPICTNCGSSHLQRRGIARTRTQNYARYQCVDCGAWSRSVVKEPTTPAKVMRII